MTITLMIPKAELEVGPGSHMGSEVSHWLSREFTCTCLL